jgi:hypothetical protein
VDVALTMVETGGRGAIPWGNVLTYVEVGINNVCVLLYMRTTTTTGFYFVYFIYLFLWPIFPTYDPGPGAPPKDTIFLAPPNRCAVEPKNWSCSGAFGLTFKVEGLL